MRGSVPLSVVDQSERYLRAVNKTQQQLNILKISALQTATVFAQLLCRPIDMSRQRFLRSAAQVGKRTDRRCYIFLVGDAEGRDYRVVCHGVGMILASKHLVILLHDSTLF